MLPKLATVLVQPPGTSMNEAATNKLNCILAVIDPTTRTQWALDKALSIARNVPDLTIVAYLCGYAQLECYDQTELRRVELERQNWWLDQIIGEQADVQLTKHIEWGEDWQTGASLTAMQYKAGLVIKSASRRPQDLGSSDRHFLREVNGDVLLVKRPPQPRMNRVLLALNLNAKDAAHKALNEKIVATGKRIRGDGGDVELHVVNACPDVDRLVHPPDLAKIVQVDRSHAHVSLGSPATAISDIANDIEADQVVIGTVRREGIAGLAIGNTAEKVLKTLQADVLVVSETV